MRTKLLVTLCLLSACSAVGCAPWSGSGRGFVDHVASVLGEQSPEALAAQRGKRAERAEPVKLAVARQAPSTPRADDAESAAPARTSSVTQAAAAEPAAVTPAVFDSCCSSCDSCDGCELPGKACPLCPLDACGKCAACLKGHRSKLFTRPRPGAPPYTYVPAMPPKFLPVPTQPTLSPARPDAPDAWRGDLEFGWRHEITSPGHD
jgi:hypothetical protein